MKVIDGEAKSGIYYGSNYKAPKTESTPLQLRSTAAAIFGFVGISMAFLWGLAAGPAQPERCNVVPENANANYDTNTGNYDLSQNSDPNEMRTRLSDGTVVRVIGGAACK